MTWRPDPIELANWKMRYERAKLAYITGNSNHGGAVLALRNLRFRDEALRIEISEWLREREAIEKQKLQKLKDEIDATTIAPSSGV